MTNQARVPLLASYKLDSFEKLQNNVRHDSQTWETYPRNVSKACPNNWAPFAGQIFVSNNTFIYGFHCNITQLPLPYLFLHLQRRRCCSLYLRRSSLCPCHRHPTCCFRCSCPRCTSQCQANSAGIQCNSLQNNGTTRSLCKNSIYGACHDLHVCHWVRLMVATCLIVCLVAFIAVTFAGLQVP